jgi:hypothetical protein
LLLFRREWVACLFVCLFEGLWLSEVGLEPQLQTERERLKRGIVGEGEFGVFVKQLFL